MVRAYLRGLNIEEISVLFVRRFDKQSAVSPIKDTLDYFVKLWRFRSIVKELRQEAQVASIPRGWIRQGL